MQSKVESDGTVQLPEKARDRLGLAAGDEVEFVLENGNVTLQRRKTDIRELRGVPSHLAAKPVSVEEMNEAISRSVDPSD
jgi:AbrB family looped-hinge helix DNA binding protein